MSKEPREFLVITVKGYWGKGRTVEEAAKEANVKGSFVRGVVYYADQSLVEGEISCTGMGGTEWKWTEQAMELVESEDYPFAFNLLSERCLKLCAGDLKITKGKLVCLQTVSEAVR